MSRLDTAARKLVDARRANDKAQKAAEKTKAVKDEVEEALFEAMDEQSLKSVTLDLGPGYGKKQFTGRQTIYSRIFNDTAAIQAFKDEGLEAEMLKPGFNKTPLNQLVKDRIKRGQPLPPGVDYSRSTGITITDRD